MCRLDKVREPGENPCQHAKLYPDRPQRQESTYITSLWLFLTIHTHISDLQSPLLCFEAGHCLPVQPACRMYLTGRTVDACRKHTRRATNDAVDGGCCGPYLQEVRPEVLLENVGRQRVRWSSYCRERRRKARVRKLTDIEPNLIPQGCQRDWQRENADADLLGLGIFWFSSVCLSSVSVIRRRKCFREVNLSAEKGK